MPYTYSQWTNDDFNSSSLSPRRSLTRAPPTMLVAPLNCSWIGLSGNSTIKHRNLSADSFDFRKYPKIEEKKPTSLVDSVLKKNMKNTCFLTLGSTNLKRSFFCLQMLVVWNQASTINPYGTTKIKEKRKEKKKGKWAVDSL